MTYVISEGCAVSSSHTSLVSPLNASVVMGSKVGCNWDWLWLEQVETCSVHWRSMVKLNWRLNKSPSFFTPNQMSAASHMIYLTPPIASPPPPLCSCLLQLLFNCCFGGKAWCCTTVVKLLCNCCVSVVLVGGAWINWMKKRYG